jgi:hypothetical protein
LKAWHGVPGFFVSEWSQTCLQSDRMKQKSTCNAKHCEALPCKASPRGITVIYRRNSRSYELDVLPLLSTRLTESWL